ncbi:thioester reductase domain-containing protein, partial [Nocardia salmonicida]|uniref:thioester reductase domain-containing protein n=1 Tax=Nocardia salmonicida TaxID=53431 RepID=UPI0037A3C9AA
EQIVAQIFADVLELGRVGVEDDFFELGGNSLSAMSARNLLTDRLGTEIPLPVVFQCSRVSDLAKALMYGAESVPSPRFSDDLILDQAITGIHADPVDRQAPMDLLLTGATGFLGIFLLRDLLATTSARIHCIVRSSDATTAEQRILATANRYGIDLRDSLDRIVGIPGDLARPMLGLGQAIFDSLAGRLDGIYHNGAHVDHLKSYAHLRAANVLGTSEVLRLATRVRRIPVHYVSTISVLSGGAAVGAPPPTSHGYALSKWVAEQLVLSAASRGVPATIYRLGLITGDTVRGAVPTNSTWWIMMRASIVLGVAPRFPSGTVDMAPVDEVSAKIVEYAQTPTLGNVVHLVGAQVDYAAIALEAGRHGYRIEVVSPEDWTSALATATDVRKDDLLARAAALIAGSTDAVEAGHGSAAGLTSPESTVRLGPVSTALLTRYFDYLLNVGFLPEPEGMSRPFRRSSLLERSPV